MKKRTFLKISLAAASSTLIPSPILAMAGKGEKKLRPEHHAVGGMGGEGQRVR